MSVGAIVAIVIFSVLFVLIAFILSVKATVTIKHDGGWSTRVKILFIEKDIVLSKILSFVLFPEQKAKEVAEADENKKQESKKSAEASADKPKENVDNSKPTENKPVKSNPIKKIWDEEGIVGILSLLSNVLETANTAILTLFRGLHIYTLCVIILVGGGDADVIARRYGAICKYYYPIKGIIVNGMKVDSYDDCIQADFLAESTEFKMELCASISVGLLVKMLLNAGIVFLKNLIKNKKGTN